MSEADRRQLNEMLSKIRTAVSQCQGPSEREVYEELVAEAEGWKMRLEELADDE